VDNELEMHENIGITHTAVFVIEIWHSSDRIFCIKMTLVMQKISCN